MKNSEVVSTTGLILEQRPRLVILIQKYFVGESVERDAF